MMSGLSDDIKKRAEVNSSARQKRKRELMEEKARALKEKQVEQTNKLMKLLEEAGIDDVVVKTTEFSSLVVQQFEPYYSVNAEYAPGDEQYHSLWRIGTKE